MLTITSNVQGVWVLERPSIQKYSRDPLPMCTQISQGWPGKFLTIILNTNVFYFLAKKCDCRVKFFENSTESVKISENLEFVLHFSWKHVVGKSEFGTSLEHHLVQFRNSFFWKYLVSASQIPLNFQTILPCNHIF